MRYTHISLLLITLGFTNLSFAGEFTALLAQVEHDEQYLMPNKTQNQQALDLSVDSQFIQEPSKQQKQTQASQKAQKSFLPDLFEGSPQKVTMDGGFIVNDDDDKSDIIDGAEISIKVKTD